MTVLDSLDTSPLSGTHPMLQQISQGKPFFILCPSVYLIADLERLELEVRAVTLSNSATIEGAVMEIIRVFVEGRGFHWPVELGVWDRGSVAVEDRSDFVCHDGIRTGYLPCSAVTVRAVLSVPTNPDCNV